MEKEDIIRKCMQQDRAAQTLLFQQQYPVLYAVIARYFRDDDTRKELLQEGFIKIFRHLGMLKEPAKFDGWAKRIVLHLCLDRIRQDKKITWEHVTDVPEQPEPAQQEYAGEAELNFESVLDVLHQLPEGYRTVFNLYAVDELTHKEIAERLGISESTSKTQLHKAKKMIRNLILENQHGFRK